MVRLISLAAIAALSLSACNTTTSGDPCAAADRRATLGNMLSNTTSGAYGACLDQLETQLAGLRIQQRSLQIEAAELRQAAAVEEGAQRAARLRLASLTENQADLMQRLSGVRAANDAEQAQLATILAEEDALRARLAAAGADGVIDAEEAAVLDAEQDRLLTGISDLE